MDKELLKSKAITRYQESIRKALDCGLPRLPKEMRDEVELRHKVCVRLGATQTEIENAFSAEWNCNEERKKCPTEHLC